MMKRYRDLIEWTVDKGDKPDTVTSRLTFLKGIAIFIFFLLLMRLWILQVITGEQFAKLAEENRIRAVPREAIRGVIMDRKGRTLVSNRPALVVSAAPSVMHNKEVVNRLSKLLKMSPQKIVAKLKEKKVDPLKPRPIKIDVEPEVVAYIEENQSKLPGVEVEVKAVRDYPFGKLAAHIVGYLGEISERELKEAQGRYDLGDVVGKAGVEKSFESVLRGQKGSEHFEVNAAGRPVRLLKNVAPMPGHSLVLALDINVQRSAEEALGIAIKQARRQGYRQANAGAAVVLDVQNGDVLALASYPTFDPRIFVGGISQKEWQRLNEKKSNYPLHIRATMASYPPGSTFKPVTALAALAEGLVQQKSSFI
jgi:penicillin-binding protein 2